MPAKNVSAGHLVLPVAGFFGVALLVSVLLASMNAWTGSLHLAPGESLTLPSLALLVAYACGLDKALRRALPGTGRQALKQRWVLGGASTLLAAPVLGLVTAPALNGLAGTSAQQSEPLRLVSVSSHTSRGNQRPHYFARLEAVGTGSLPAGRYFLGTYAQAWSPQGELPVPGTSVLVTYRRGLLGKTTVLSAMPCSAGSCTAQGF